MIRILLFIAIWMIPICIFTTAYIKMNQKERQEFKDSLKKPFVLWGFGSIIIGLLLLFSGIVLAVKPVQYSGVIMICISWLTTSIVSWKKGITNLKKSAVLVLMGVIGIIAYAVYI